MTMTKIPSRKPSGTYGHGPLKIGFWKGKDDDHDQDFLKKGLLHIWSWSSDKSSGQIFHGFPFFFPMPWCSAHFPLCTSPARLPK